MRAFALSCVAWASLTACGKDGYEISGPKTVATGVPFTVKVGDACPQPHTKGLSSLCFDDPVTAIDSASVSPPFLLDRQELVGINAEFGLHATAEGSAELALALQGSLGRHMAYTYALDAHDIDEVSVRPRCAGPATEPLLVFAGQPLLFDFELRGDGLTLFADQAFPFQSSASPPSLFMPGIGRLETPQKVASLTLTSTVSPGFRLALQTIDLARFDGVSLERDSMSVDRPVPIGGSMGYVPKLSIAGQPPCVGPGFFDATYTIDTPTSCHFQSDSSPYFLDHNVGGVTVIGAGVGSCRLHISVTGTALIGRAEFPVVAAQ